MTWSYHLIVVVISLLVLLDLSGAFDTIDHNILLNRLETLLALEWKCISMVLKSYLSDRHQFVAVNEEVSYRLQVQYGVPHCFSTRAVTFHALYVTHGKYHQETWG